MALEKLSHSMLAWLDRNGDHAPFIWKLSLFCQYKTKRTTLLLKLANYPLWSKGWSENIFVTLIFIRNTNCSTFHKIFIKWAKNSSILKLSKRLNLYYFSWSKKETNLYSSTEILYKKVPRLFLVIKRFERKERKGFRSIFAIWHVSNLGT